MKVLALIALAVGTVVTVISIWFAVKAPTAEQTAVFLIPECFGVILVGAGITILLDPKR